MAWAQTYKHLKMARPILELQEVDSVLLQAMTAWWALTKKMTPSTSQATKTFTIAQIIAI